MASLYGMTEKIEKSDAQWREELSPERYQVLREKGTEPPFSGAYTYSKSDGMYRCGACGAELFSSGTKFDSGTGWPSFTEPAVAEAVELHEDNSLGMSRTEVTCARCGGIWGTSSPTARGRPASATASTRWRWISTRINRARRRAAARC